MKNNYLILVFNGMKEDIFTLSLKAKDKMEARELIEPNLKNFDIPIILNENQIKILIEKLEKIK